MWRKKDGSLNLSIQAIVILVMAMALLGLGLGFIRGLMSQSEDQFSVAIDNAQLENPATAENPVTVDRTVEVKAGKTAKVRIGFYNSGFTNTAGFEPALDVNCKEGTIDYFISSGAQTVSVGEAKGFEAILTAPSSAGAGTTKVCTIEFMDGSNAVVASKQFYIDIVS